MEGDRRENTDVRSYAGTRNDDDRSIDRNGNRSAGIGARELSVNYSSATHTTTRIKILMIYSSLDYRVNRIKKISKNRARSRRSCYLDR